MTRAILLLALIFYTNSTNAATIEKTKNTQSTSSPSIHYVAEPVLYDFDNMPLEKISNDISRQYVHTAQSTTVKWFLKKGAHIPLHHHVNEQVTWITKGSVRVLSQGKEYIVKAGGVLAIPANVPHEFFALEDTIDIDFFTPARQDWIDGTASYYTNEKK